MGKTKGTRQAFPKLLIVIFITHVDLQYNEVLMQHVFYDTARGDKAIQPDTIRTPVTTKFDQYPSITLPGVLQCILSIDKGIAGWIE